MRVLGRSSPSGEHPVIRIERVDVQFSEVRIRPFSEDALRAVKRIQGRQWDEDERVWLIPTEAIHHVVRRFHDLGESVVVNGQGFDPLRAVEETNPFVPLLLALPEHLQDRVFNALVTVFASVDSDDGSLFAQLCDAIIVIERESKIATKAKEKAAQPKTRTMPAAAKHTRPEAKPVRRLVRRSA
jgi:hypothetical protein